MTEYTLLGNQVPFIVDANDGAGGVVLGMKFRSQVSGWITKARFYKSVANTGQHMGYLWEAGTGVLLASTIFQNETASGWQEQVFSLPVAITSNTTYLISYFAPIGHYSATSQFFESTYSVPPLTAVSSGTEPNGIYQYTDGGSSAVMPQNTFNAANYWVDVVFADSLGSTPTVSFKSRESGVWVPHTAVPKVRQSGAWVNAQPKRWTGTAWVNLT